MVFSHFWRLATRCIAISSIGLLTACGGSGETAATPPAMPSASINTVPVANAGADQSVALNAVVTLDGTASTDADGDALTLNWVFIERPASSAATLSSAIVSNPTFTADIAGNYVVQLIVNDGKVDSAADFVTITATLPSNRPPTANAGSDRSVALSSIVALDGTGSSDADGDQLTYRWTIAQQPAGSAVSLSSAAAAEPTFSATHRGQYVFSLVVNDGVVDSAADMVTITAGNGSPSVDAGVPERHFYINNTVPLTGSAADPEGDSLTYLWELVSAPSGNTGTIVNPTALSTSFVPTAPGDYRLRFTASDGASSNSDTARVTIYSPVMYGLTYSVIDAEYSKSLDRIVLVATEPNRLYVHDALTGGYQSVDLRFTPTSVSVSPNGNYAAVGHNGWISYVNLTTFAVSILQVTTDVLDVVLPGNGYVYAFPRQGQWEGVRAVNIASGVETTGGMIYAGTLARLHPGGNAIYGADNGLSPADIERYDISTGPVSAVRDSPYHGDYAMCGNLWFSEEGLRIFTRCGNTFTASAVPSEDMLYRGSLTGTTSIQHLHHATASGNVLALADTLSIHDYATLAREGLLQLPQLNLGTRYPMTGRFVFHSTDASKFYIVARTAASPGPVANPFAVIIYGTNGDPLPNLAPVANAGSDQTVLVGTNITLDGRASSDPNWQNLQYRWRLLSAPPASVSNLVDDGSSRPTFVADVTGRYEFALEVHDGALWSAADTVVIHAVQAELRTLNFLPFDAEFSGSLNRIVMVGSDSNTLHIYNPLTGGDTLVSLSQVPTSVSVSPDGLSAVVGHNGSITSVNVADPTANDAVVSWPVDINVGDVVHGGNGYAYAFPAAGSQWTNIRAVRLSDGAVSVQTGYSIYAGTVGRRHSSGTAIYGANRGLSPADIEKYGIHGGSVAYLYNSPYHGDFAMCGDVWPSADGDRLVTACGNVFRSTTTQATDMTYFTALSAVRSVQFVADSQAAGATLAIARPGVATADTVVHKFASPDMAYITTIPLPYFMVNTSAYLAHGRFVFYNSTGGEFYVVAHADAASGLVHNYGVIRIVE